jgi:hypothetical protein
MARTISSPGVEINEVDLSLRVNAPIGVNVLAMGFTNQGPTDEIFQITSLEEYEALFGKPTTPAERYSYHTINLCLIPLQMCFSQDYHMVAEMEIFFPARNIVH